MTIDKFLDIIQPIRNKGNSLFLVTLMCEYVAVYACYVSLGNIILKCNHGIKSLSTRDVSKVIFKHIDDFIPLNIDLAICRIFNRNLLSNFRCKDFVHSIFS